MLFIAKLGLNEEEINKKGNTAGLNKQMLPSNQIN